MDETDIGDRIRPLLPAHGLSQNQLAAEVAMPRDALSRAMTGKRGFSSVEVARIAERLDVSVHWLITGRPDPHAMTAAARCAYDAEGRSYSNPGRDDDGEILDSMRLAYAQAWVHGAPASRPVPQDPALARRELGDHFVRGFSDRIETVYGVDVVRAGDVQTDYALKIGERDVIVVAATDAWFRENWSLAHELGHIAHSHLQDTDEDRARTEPAANAFAADLLLPEAEVRGVEWSTVDALELGRLLWGWGVSTTALRHRLANLRIDVPAEARGWLAMNTIAFLRQHARPETGWRPLVERQREATARRFPTELIERHEAGVAAGRLNKATLAWMLGIEVANIGTEPESDPGGMDMDDLAAALGLASA